MKSLTCAALVCCLALGTGEVRAQPKVRTIAPVVPSTPLLGFSGTMVHGLGMRVNHVNHGSLARRIGLERGDVIVRMNGVQVKSHGHYLRLLDWSVQRNNGYLTLEIQNVRDPYGPLVHRRVRLTDHGHGHLPGVPLS